MRTLLAVALSCCLPPAVAAPRAQAPRPPSSAEQGKLVAEYLSLSGRTADGRSRQLEILARLEAVPPLRDSQVDSWRKKLRKAFDKAGPRLQPKAGRHYWDEQARTGLYLVGGKLARPRGLAICMHGGGAGSGDAESAKAAFDSALTELGWVAIYPEVLEKTEHGWTTSGTEEWVLDLVAAARRTFGFPGDKVFFCGHSMGGYGTWMLGAHHADLVAGLAASAGAPTPILEAGSQKVVDVVEGVIPSLRNVRLAIYQADDDPNVPPDANRMAASRLAQAKEKWGGFDYEYWEESGRGHDLPPGGPEALLTKVADAVRQPCPERVVWQPQLPWKRQFYWLHWETPVPGAVVVADLDRAANAVTLRSDKGVAGLSVLLDGRLVDLDKEVVVRLGESEVYRGKPPAQLASMLLTAASGDPDLVFPCRIPLP